MRRRPRRERRIQTGLAGATEPAETTRGYTGLWKTQISRCIESDRPVTGTTSTRRATGPTTGTTGDEETQLSGRCRVFPRRLCILGTAHNFERTSGRGRTDRPRRRFPGRFVGWFLSHQGGVGSGRRHDITCEEPWKSHPRKNGFQQTSTGVQVVFTCATAFHAR